MRSHISIAFTTLAGDVVVVGFDLLCSTVTSTHTHALSSLFSVQPYVCGGQRFAG